MKKRKFSYIKNDLQKLGFFTGSRKLDLLRTPINNWNKKFSELTYEQSKWYYLNNQTEKGIKKWYKIMTNGQTLNLENPVTLSEKVQWLKLYDATPLKTLTTDKILVKDWVAKKIGKKYITNIIEIYDNVSQINLDKLPKIWVIKTNHDCMSAAKYDNGDIRKFKSKKDINKKEFFQNLDCALSHNFAFRCGFELQYLNIKPKILIEEYTLDKPDPVSKHAFNYHFYCFNGKVLYVNCVYNTAPVLLTFSIDWIKQDWSFLPGVNIADRIDNNPPKFYHEMIELAEELSKDFAFVRVDFRIYNNMIIFEEMTFSSNSGLFYFLEDNCNKELGDLIILPEKKDIPKWDVQY